MVWWIELAVGRLGFDSLVPVIPDFRNVNEAAIGKSLKLQNSYTYEANAAMLVTFILRPITQNVQLVLPVQTGLYRYNEWMVQEMNDEDIM